LFEQRKDELLANHTWSDVYTLGAAQGVCILLLTLFTYARRSLDRKFQEMASNPISPYSRALSSIQIIIAMTMSWSALYLFFWITADLFEVDHHFVEIISAAVLTGFAIIGILVLDAVADKVEESSIPDFESETIDESSTSGLPKKKQSVAGDVLGAAVDIHQEALKQALDLKNMEQALRTLIDSFALAVGLAWEKAFHAALVTVVMNVPFSKHHRVIANFSMALFSCTLMLPIWLKFMVPMAQRSVSDFENHMKLERDQAAFH
jgi:hypothetical protein